MSAWRFTALLPMILAAATAVAEQGRGPRADDASARDVRARALALRAEDERDARAPGLDSLLASQEPGLRRRAALALGRIGDPASIPQLARLLSDPVPAVRHEAAFALGQVGSPDAESTLLSATLSRDPGLCALAGEALAKLEWRDDDARRRAGALVVARLLGAVPCCEGVAGAGVARVARASWRFGAGTPGLADALARLARDPSEDVAEAAIYAAFRASDPALEPVLAAACRRSSAAQRALGARGLARIVKPMGALEGGAERVAALRGVVLPLVQDADPRVRVAALTALAAFPPPEAGGAAALAGNVSSSDHQVQRAALGLARAWRVAEAHDVLRQLIGSDRRDLAPDAILALAAIEGARALPDLAAQAASADWTRRAAVAEALADPELAASGEAQALQDALLADGDARVVAAALEAAARPPRPGSEALALAHLAHEDVVVRAIACGRLAELALAEGGVLSRAEAARELRTAFARAAKDALTDARLASLEALVQVEGDAARDGLARALQDREYSVRLKARELARLLSPEAAVGLPAAGTVGTGRPLEFYEEVVRRVELGPARTLTLATERGDVVIDLLAGLAPLNTLQVGLLAKQGFFDGLAFHRVVPDFVAQGGDPRGDGWGGPGQTVRCETHAGSYRRGAVGMALSGKDTGGSQFFLTLSAQPHLEGRYTLIGVVRPECWPIMDELRRFDTIRSARLDPQG